MAAKDKRKVKVYEIVYVAAILLLLGLGILQMRPHRVGVVDLNQAADVLGFQDRIRDAYERERADSARRVEALNAELDRQFKGLQARYTAATNATEQQVVREAMEQTRRSARETVRREQSALQAYRRRAVLAFRRALQPFIDRVARKRRMDVVVESGAALLYTHARVELTDEIIKAAAGSFDVDEVLAGAADIDQPPDEPDAPNPGVDQ